MRPGPCVSAMLGVVILQLGSAAVAAEPLSVLLEKGIYAEETLGDLDQAIRIYGQISAKSKAERPIAAQAQFRQGRCLLAKGDQARAAVAFRSLISDYPDQKDLVAEAQKLLGDLRAAGQNPPAVLETQPKAFDDAVPATLTEIKVTFDQKMKDGCWSWAIAEAKTKPAGEAEAGVRGSFGRSTGFLLAGPAQSPKIAPRQPRLTGPPRYDDKKATCSVPAELRSGTVYRLEINASPSAAKFQSSQGVAAQTYVILFATQGKDGKPTPIPEDLVAEAATVNDRNRSLDRIRADIYVLRHQVVVGGCEEWIGAMYRLAQDGRRAVPELVMELLRQSPEHQLERRVLAFTLRAIGDPRAVPALIQELAKCPYEEGSDCAVNLPYHEQWAQFVSEHQAERPKTARESDQFGFYRAVREISGALEKITGHSEGSRHYDTRPTPVQSLRLRKEVSQRWQIWWDAHAIELLMPEELAEVRRWQVMSRKDPIQEAGLRIVGPMIPTGPEYRFGPEKQMVIRTQVPDRLGRGGWKMGDTYVDLDTGRAYGGRPYPEIKEPWDAKQRRKEAQWDEERGIDIDVQSSGSDDLENTLLTMHDCLGWALEPGAWQATIEAVGKPEPLKLPPMSHRYFVRKKGDQLVDTFLFRTREGGVALVQVQEAMRKEWSVKFWYRMLCRKNASGPLAQLGKTRSAATTEESASSPPPASWTEEATTTRLSTLPARDWTRPLDAQEHDRALALAERIVLEDLRKYQAVEKEKGWSLVMVHTPLGCLAQLGRGNARDLLLEGVYPEIRPSVTFARELRRAGDKRVDERVNRALTDSNSPPSERVKWLRLWWGQDPRTVLPPEVEDYIVKKVFEDPEHNSNPSDPSNWVDGWISASLTRAVTERSRRAIEERLLAQISNTQARPEIGWHDGPSRLCAHLTPGLFSPRGATTCVKALVHINNPASKDVLLRVVREGPPNGVRACAAIGLHHFGNDAEKKLAVGALRDIYRQLKWVPVTEEYAFRMAYLGDAYGLQQLRGFMRHKDASIRAQAYRDLQALDDRSFIPIAAQDYPDKNREPNGFDQIVNWGGLDYDEQTGQVLPKDCVAEYLHEVFRTAKNYAASGQAMRYLLLQPDERLEAILPRCRSVLEEPLGTEMFEIPYSKPWHRQIDHLIGLLRAGSPDEKRQAMQRLAELFAMEERLKSHPTAVIVKLCYSRYKPAQRLLTYIMETYPGEPAAEADKQRYPDVRHEAAYAFLLIESGRVGLNY